MIWSNYNLFLIILLLLNILIDKSVYGACPNHCNQNGMCLNGNVCWCDAGYDGGAADCSFRECPIGTAWADKPYAENLAHRPMECSNAGICNRRTGECACMKGYTGAACNRLSCPNNCNNRGRCLTMLDMTLYEGIDYDSSQNKYIGNAGDGLGTIYTNWDNSSLVMCACDMGYFGPDCSLKMCPKGDDPVTLNQQTRKIMISIQSPTSLTGNIGIRFQGQTTFLDLSYPSAHDCKTSFETGAKYSDIECQFNEVVSNKIYNYTIEFIEWPLFPQENNLYSHDGNPLIGEFYCDISQEGTSQDATCIFSDVVNTNLREYRYCGDRGICDYEYGVCSCVQGYSGPACANRTTVDPTRSTGFPGLLVNAHGSSFQSSVLKVETTKSKASDFFLLEALANSERIFYVRGDGLVGFSQLTIGSGGLIVDEGGLSVAKLGLELSSTTTSEPSITVDSTYTKEGTSTAMLVSSRTEFPTTQYLMYCVNKNIVRFYLRSDGFGEIFGGGLAATNGGTILQGGLSITGGMTINDLGLEMATGGMTINKNGMAVLRGGMTIKQDGLLVEQGTTVFTKGLEVTTGGFTLGAGGMEVTAGGITVSNGGLQVTSGMTIQTGGLKVTHGINVWKGDMYLGDGGMSINIGGLKVSGGLTLVQDGSYVDARKIVMGSDLETGPEVGIHARSTSKSTDVFGPISGGSIRISSGYNSQGASGDMILETPDGGKGGDSGSIVLSTGTSSFGTTGAIYIGTSDVNEGGAGIASGTEAAGEIKLTVGSGDSGAGGDITLSSGSGDGNLFETGGRIEIFSGLGATSTGDILIATSDGNKDSGSIVMSTGDANNADSGGIFIGTGDSDRTAGTITVTVGATDTGIGGSLKLEAGDTSSGTGTTGGHVRIASGRSDGTSSGSMAIITPDAPGSGLILLSTGVATGGDSGDISIGTGTASSTGGDIELKVGSSVSMGGSITIHAGNGTTNNFETGGKIRLDSGFSSTSHSGKLEIMSQNSPGHSGSLVLSTGNTPGGTSGDITISTGPSTTGVSGKISVKVGGSGSGAGGDLTLTAGDSSSAAGGDVIIRSGHSSQHYGGDIAISPGDADADGNIGTVYIYANASKVTSADPHLSFSHTNGIEMSSAGVTLLHTAGGISMTADNGVDVKSGGLYITGGTTVDSGGLAVTDYTATFHDGMTVVASGLSIAAGGFNATDGLTVTDIGLAVELAGFTIYDGGLQITNGLTITDQSLTVVAGDVTVVGGVTVETDDGNGGGLAIDSGGLTVTAGDMSIQDTGLKVTGGMTVDGGAVISGTNGGLVVTADGATVFTTGMVLESTGMEVTGGSTVYTGGAVVASGITITPTGGGGADGFVIEAGGLTISADNIGVTTGGMKVTGGLTMPNNGISIDLGGLQVTGGTTTYSDMYVVQDGATITAGGLVVTTGLTVSDTGLTINDGTFYSADGLIITGGTTVTADGLLVTGGLTIVQDGMTIEAGGLSTSAGGLTVETLKMTATTDFAASANMFTIDSAVTVTDKVHTGGGMTVTSGNLNVGSALTIVNGLTVGGAATIATPGLAVDANGLTVAGGVSVDGGAVTVQNSGLTVKDSGLLVSSHMTVDSLVMSGASLTMTSDGGMTISTALDSASALTIGSGALIVESALTVTDGVAISTAGTIKSSSLVVEDGMDVGNGLDVSASGFTVQNSGLVMDATAGDLVVTGAGLTVTTSTIDLTSKISGGLDITGGLTLNDVLTVTNGVTIDTGGLSVMQGGLTVEAGNLIVKHTVSASGVLDVAGDVVSSSADSGYGFKSRGNLKVDGTAAGLTMSTSGGMDVSGASGLKVLSSMTVVGGIAVTNGLTVTANGMTTTGGVVAESATVASGLALSHANSDVTVKAGGVTLGDPFTAGAITVSSGDLKMGTSGSAYKIKLSGTGKALTMTSLKEAGPVSVNAGGMTITGTLDVTNDYTSTDNTQGDFKQVTVGNVKATRIVASGSVKSSVETSIGGGLKVTNAMNIKTNEGFESTKAATGTSIEYTTEKVTVQNGASKIGGMTSTNDKLKYFKQGQQAGAARTTTVEGSLRFSNTNNDLYYGGSLSYSSDARLKQNVRRVLHPLESLKKINGVYFRWKDPLKDDKKGIEIGVIAQDLLDSVPSAVKLVKDEKKDVEKNNEESSYYQVDYNNLCSVLVEGIKELTEKSKTCNELPSFQSLAARVVNLKANLTNLYELESIANARIQEHKTTIEELRINIGKMKRRLE